MNKCLYRKQTNISLQSFKAKTAHAISLPRLYHSVTFDIKCSSTKAAKQKQAYPTYCFHGSLYLFFLPFSVIYLFFSLF